MVTKLRLHLTLQSYKELLYRPFYTAENNGERNELLNKWKQAGQVLNIIQFKIPTSFTFFIRIIFEADSVKKQTCSRHQWLKDTLT